MTQSETNDLLLLEEEKFKNDFLQKVDIADFIQAEQTWIRNNMDFIFSNKPKEVNLGINPYCRFVEVDSFTEEGSVCKEEYILLPKNLSLQQLYIHVGKVDKADKMINLMKNYKYQFTLSEISNLILSNCETTKRDIMEKRLNTLICKFLSYQYLVII